MNGKNLSSTIDNIKDKLDKLTQEEYKKNNKPIELPPEAALLIKKRNRNIKGSKDYLDLINKQRWLQFKGGLNNNENDKNMPTHLLEGSTISNSGFKEHINLLEDLDLNMYKRPWGKLEHELKINRAMHFIQKEIKKHNLTIEEAKKLRILLIQAINKRIITKKSDVNYCTDTCDLIEIYNLKYDPNTRTYDLDGYVPPISTENIISKQREDYITHVTKLSPSTLRRIAPP